MWLKVMTYLSCGSNPKGIVIHNDAGSKGATAEAYRNGLVNAPLSRLEAGIAHSYVSGNTVWQALDESQVGWHTANQIGNKYYYGIEVCQSMGADNATFLKMNRQLSKNALDC